jgi:hypothetical protein
MLGRDFWKFLMPSNNGLQADGETAVVRGSVVQAHVRGGFAPAAEPWALAGPNESNILAKI